MTPLSELPEERLRALRGVIFDIDDTVTEGGRLQAEAFAALDDLRRAGVRLLAVTGRPLGWADGVAALWPVDGAVGENGAGWAYREGHGLTIGYAEDEATRREQRALLETIRDRAARDLPEVPVASDQAARRCDLAFDIGEAHPAPPEAVARLVDLIEAAGARSSVSSVHCHAVPGAWDKARGATAALAALFGETADTARAHYAFIGDSGNDAAAFAFFEVAVGVANVRAHLPRLPVPPAYVTDAPRGRGFAELAARVLDARA